MSDKEVASKDFNKLIENISISIWLKILTILFWVYLVSSVANVFVYDWMSQVSAKGPIFNFIVDFRFYITLPIIAVIWILLGNQKFFNWSVYILFYPWKFLFWDLPIFLFDKLSIIIGFMPSVHSGFKYLKVNFLSFSFSLLSIVFIFKSGIPPSIIVISMSVLALSLIWHFIKKIRITFSSQTIYSSFADGIRKLYEKSKTAWNNEKLTGLDPNSEEYKHEYGQNLIGAYGSYSVLSHLATKLREAQSNHMIEIYIFVTISYTVLVTTFIFSLEYYALNSLDNSHFTGVTEPSYINFVLYSFGTIVRYSVTGIVPVSSVAIAFTYFQVIFAIIIVVLLFSKLVSVFKERHMNSLDRLISLLDDQIKDLEGEMTKNSELTVRGIETLLVKLNFLIAKLFLLLKYGKSDSKKIVKDLLQIEKDDN